MASALAPSAALPPPSPTLLPSPDEADAITAAAVSAMGDLDITSAVVPLDGLEAELAALKGHPAIAAVLGGGDGGGGSVREGASEATTSPSPSSLTAALAAASDAAGAALAAAEAASVGAYVAEADNLEELHGQILACDAGLAGLESTLSAFQAGLGGLSSDIRGLQARTAGLSTRLANRRAAGAALGDALAALAPPPALISAIAGEGWVENAGGSATVAPGVAPPPDGVIADPAALAAFAAALGELGRRLTAAAGAPAALAAAAAAAEAGPALEKLRSRGAARARAHLLARIFALRRPKTNVRVLQAATLAPSAPLAAFLRDHAPEVCGEVRSAYVETLARVLAGHLKAYVGALDRLVWPVGSGGSELLQRRRSSGGGSAGGTPLGPSSSAPSLPPGGGLLGPDDLAGAPPPPAGSAGGTAGGLAAGAGALVSSLLRAAAGGVSGNAAPSSLGTPRASGSSSSLTVGPSAAALRYGLRGREALLLRLDRPAAIVPHAAEAAGDRFPPEALLAAADRLLMDAATSEFVFCGTLFGSDGPFTELIAPAIAVVEGWVTGELLPRTADPVALLLMIRVARAHALAMARRAVPALDAYHDRLALALWPRFKGRLDAHADSLAAAGSPSHAAAEPPGVGGRAPHPLAARVAALTGALATLAADMAEPQVDAALRRLRVAARGALARLGARLTDRGDAAAFVAAQAHFFLATARADAAAAAATPRPPGGGASAAVAAVGGEEAAHPHPLGPAGAAAEEEAEREWGSAAAAWAATAVAARLPQLAAAAATPTPDPAAAAAFAGGDWKGALSALASDAGRAFRGYPPAAAPAGRAAGEAAIQAFRAAGGGDGLVEEMLAELGRLGGGGV